MNLHAPMKVIIVCRVPLCAMAQWIAIMEKMKTLPYVNVTLIRLVSTVARVCRGTLRTSETNLEHLHDHLKKKITTFLVDNLLFVSIVYFLLFFLFVKQSIFALAVLQCC